MRGGLCSLLIALVVASCPSLKIAPSIFGKSFVFVSPSAIVPLTLSKM